MWRSVLLASVGACLAVSVTADVVVTKDGRRHSGEVIRTPEGYTVKTKLGVINVAEADFAQLIIGEAPSSTVTTPVTPPLLTPMTTPATGGPATVVKPSLPGKAEPKSLAPLIEQGKAALAAGEYKSARDAFADASSIDPRNATALHGLGVAYMYLNDFKSASTPMERILGFGALGDRATVLNVAVLQIGVNNPMRAVKFIKEYLTTHTKALDEPLLNAMGTAMSLASDSARKQTLFQDAVKFYFVYNAQLNAARPGYKRWGVEWLPADEVDRRQTEYDVLQKNLQTLGRAVDDLEAKIARDEAELVKKRDLSKRGFVGDYELQILESAQMKQKESFTQKATEYDTLAASAKRPSFPLTMSLVPIDQFTPPPVGGDVAVAMVTPVAPAEPPVMPRSSHQPKPISPGPGSSGGGSSKPPEIPETPVIQLVRVTPVAKKKMHVTAYAAAFPVSSDLVVTSAAAVKGSIDIDLQTVVGDTCKAQIVRVDETTGLALLRVTGKRLSALPLAAGFTGGPIVCAGYPTPNLFNPAAEAIAGSAKAPSAEWKVNLSKHPRLAGAPLLSGSRVVGVSLATRDADPMQAPAVSLEELRKFLGEDGVSSGGIVADPASVMLQVMATRETEG